MMYGGSKYHIILQFENMDNVPDLNRFCYYFGKQNEIVIKNLFSLDIYN